MPHCLHFLSLPLLLLVLSACSASLTPGGIESKVTQVAASPSAVCTAVLSSEARDLAQLRASLGL